MRYAERKRHEFIADHVAKNGTINRKDICNKFGVHLCQASKDLAKFQENHPGLLKYDRRKKHYYVPGFQQTEMDKYINEITVNAENIVGGYLYETNCPAEVFDAWQVITERTQAQGELNG